MCLFSMRDLTKNWSRVICSVSDCDAVWDVLGQHVDVRDVQAFVAGLDFVCDVGQPLLELLDAGQNVWLREALVGVVAQIHLCWGGGGNTERAG